MYVNFCRRFPSYVFRDEQVALRIDGEVVGAVELSGPVAGTSEGAHHLEGIALEHMHLLVGAVGNEQELLTRIDGESDVPHRSAAERVLRHEGLLDERALSAKYLEPVI